MERALKSSQQVSYRHVERALKALADPTRAASSCWFFKTGPGEYGEGDHFLGLTVPVQRKIALQYRHLGLDDLAHLLASKYHEHRFTALEILVARYEDTAEDERRPIIDFYMAQTSRINNWDLVDTSAPYILGDFLRWRPRDLLDRLAASSLLWERRIAIVATLGLVKHGEIADTFRIAEMLLGDAHDLIQKAVGWALREAGRVSRPALLKFIRTHYARVPRTTLRYAIEHLDPAHRKRILAGNFGRG